MSRENARFFPALDQLRLDRSKSTLRPLHPGQEFFCECLANHRHTRVFFFSPLGRSSYPHCWLGAATGRLCSHLTEKPGIKDSMLFLRDISEETAKLKLIRNLEVDKATVTNEAFLHVLILSPFEQPDLSSDSVSQTNLTIGSVAQIVNR